MLVVGLAETLCITMDRVPHQGLKVALIRWVMFKTPTKWATHLAIIKSTNQLAGISKAVVNQEGKMEPAHPL